MKMTVRILIAGLIMGGGAHSFANAADPSRASLDTPITSIELDENGNVIRITFSNGAELGVKELEIDTDVIKPGEVEISGIRRLPFHVLKEEGSMVVVADFVGMTPVSVPSGTGVVLNIRQGEQVDLLLSEDMLACPENYCSFFGKCKPCALADADHSRFHTLVEYEHPSSGERKLTVLPATLEPRSP